jgi:hypothetical protein
MDKVGVKSNYTLERTVIHRGFQPGGPTIVRPALAISGVAGRSVKR